MRQDVSPAPTVVSGRDKLIEVPNSRNLLNGQLPRNGDLPTALEKARAAYHFSCSQKLDVPANEKYWVWERIYPLSPVSKPLDSEPSLSAFTWTLASLARAPCAASG